MGLAATQDRVCHSNVETTYLPQPYCCETITASNDYAEGSTDMCT